LRDRPEKKSFQAKPLGSPIKIGCRRNSDDTSVPSALREGTHNIISINTEDETMKNQRKSINVGLMAAGIAASAMAMAGNTIPATQAATTAAKSSTSIVGKGRTPVVQVTPILGDVGMELLDGKTPSIGLSKLSDKTANAIIYIDVDSLDLSQKRTRALLDLARNKGWVVMAESATWDVPRLHAFLATYYPGVDTRGLENVAVRIASDKARARVLVTDLSPAEAAVEMGMDYADTSQAKAQRELAPRMFRQIPDTSRAPAYNYAWFASKAYEGNPPQTHDGFHRIVNKDVVKVYEKAFHCIVAWRGSTTAGDWLRNIENQFGFAKPIPGDAQDNPAKAGAGYVTRLQNYKDNIPGITTCRKYSSVGHSLGGGMASLFAYFKGSTAPQYALDVEAFNPARVGNSEFASRFKNRVGHWKILCRDGDPVKGVPVGLKHPADGCTTNAPGAVSGTSVKNHDMKLWL
jgi:hypothetical protein